jgi:hypothetical protein
MGAVTEKLKTEMAPAYFAFGREAMAGAHLIHEASCIISDLSLLSVEEAVELEGLFRLHYDEAEAEGKSAVVCNLFHELFTICRAIRREGTTAAEAREAKGWTTR